MILHTEFGLIWTTPWPDEKELFLKFSKIPNSRKSQTSVWKPNFFLGKLYQQFFLLYTLITLVILHSEFGLIWTTPWPDEKELFLKFSKFGIREIRKIPYENEIFSWTSYTKNTFSFTLSLFWLYSMPSLVLFAQLLNPMKNNYF